MYQQTTIVHAELSGIIIATKELLNWKIPGRNVRIDTHCPRALLAFDYKVTRL